MAEKAIFGNMELTLYKDVYSLVAVREYNGNYYQEWCKKEYGKDKKLSDKSTPVKVVLGGSDEAVATLLEVIYAITGEWYEPRRETGNEKVPF